MKTSIHRIAAVLFASMFAMASAQAELKFQAQPVKPELKLQAAAGAPKPPVCAPGFTPVGQKLMKHEGKQWFEYTCAHEEVINRVCNVDTSVTEVKDQFVSLPSDGKSKKSKLQMSYKCFNYVPVE